MLSWTGLGRGVALLAVGAAGAAILAGIGVPAGFIIGALLCSGIYRLAGGAPGPWRGHYGRVGRLLFGTVIGAAFGPDVLGPLKSALLPMVVVTTVLIGAGLGLGWVLSRLTSLDIATALTSVVPGGLPVMVAMADESEADATIVAAIHFSRLTTLLILAPALIPLLASASSGTASVAPMTDPVGLGRTALILAAGAASGLMAVRAGVPTGDLVGPILVVGGVNLLGAGPNPLAGGFRQGAMLLIGTAVGAGVTRESLLQLRKVALPASAVIATLLGAGLSLGWGLSQVTSLDLASAMLSSVPGGASTMPAVAHDLGGDMRLVAALHLVRQLVIFVLMPTFLEFLLRRERRRHASIMGS